ncbi:MAG: hypothetical protein AAGA67_01280 [Cyanobacteria bacterium P01_F01_bin.153]
MVNFSPTSAKLAFSKGKVSWGAGLVAAMAIAPSLLVGLFLGLPQSAVAQSSGNADDLGEWQNNERDSRSIGGTGLTPLDLIQQIRTLSGQSPAEFEARQEGRLNDAAESFRQQQRQQLGSPDNAENSTSNTNGE